MSSCPSALTSAPSLVESPVDCELPELSWLHAACDVECSSQTSKTSARSTCANAASAAAVELLLVWEACADHGATSAWPSGVAPVPMSSLGWGLLWSVPPEICVPSSVSELALELPP